MLSDVMLRRAPPENPGVSWRVCCFFVDSEASVSRCCTVDGVLAPVFRAREREQRKRAGEDASTNRDNHDGSNAMGAERGGDISSRGDDVVQDSEESYSVGDHGMRLPWSGRHATDIYDIVQALREADMAVLSSRERRGSSLEDGGVNDSPVAASFVHFGGRISDMDSVVKAEMCPHCASTAVAPAPDATAEFVCSNCERMCQQPEKVYLPLCMTLHDPDLGSLQLKVRREVLESLFQRAHPDAESTRDMERAMLGAEIQGRGVWWWHDCACMVQGDTVDGVGRWINVLEAEIVL
jgi:hypothetical protein